MNINQNYLLWEHVSGIEHASPDDPSIISRRDGLKSNLKRTVTINKGLYAEKIFKDQDDNVIIHETFSYDFDGQGLIKKTITTRFAIAEGGFGDIVKTQTEEYDRRESRKLSISRRKVIIDEMVSKAEDLGILGGVQALFVELSAQLASYKATGDNRMLVSIQNHTAEWLDSIVPGTTFTMRQVILSELTI